MLQLLVLLLKAAHVLPRAMLPAPSLVPAALLQSILESARVLALLMLLLLAAASGFTAATCISGASSS